MGTLLEAIGIVLETYFRFGFPNEFPIGDSLIVRSMAETLRKRKIVSTHICITHEAVQFTIY